MIWDIGHTFNFGNKWGTFICCASFSLGHARAHSGKIYTIWSVALSRAQTPVIRKRSALQNLHISALLYTSKDIPMRFVDTIWILRIYFVVAGFWGLFFCTHRIISQVKSPRSSFSKNNHCSYIPVYICPGPPSFDLPTASFSGEVKYALYSGFRFRTGELCVSIRGATTNLTSFLDSTYPKAQSTHCWVRTFIFGPTYRTEEVFQPK